MTNGGEAGLVTLRELGLLCVDLLKFPMPVVAAMNGHAFAGGAVMGLACDWRVMRKDRGYFCLNEVDVPLPLPMPVYKVIRDKCDQAHWPDMVMRGKRFNAEEALAKGIVDDIADESELIDRAIELAEQIGAKDRWTFGKIKEEMYRESIQALSEARITTELESFPRLFKKYEAMMGGSSSRSYSSTVNRGYSSMFVREFSSDLKSRAIFDKMGGIIEEDGEAMVAKVGHVYHFGVRAEKGGDLTYFTMDLKNGTGSSTEG